MEARQLILNLVPGGVLPNIKCSQYDKGIPVEATIYDGDSLYEIPASAQVYVQGTKKDGTIYQYLCGFSGSTVTFALTQQMTLVAGENIAEVSIHNNGTIVGTINFVINVEAAALQDNSHTSVDDIPAIADLPGLVERAEDAAEEATAALEDVREIAGSIDADFDRLDAAVTAAKTSAELAAFYATSTQEMLAIATAEMDGKVAAAADSADEAAGYADDARATLTSTQDVLDLALAEIDIIEARVNAQAGKASTSADLAAFYAGKASTSADMAAALVDDAEYWAKMSESWTQGKTGIRTGENENNAKYWAEKAQSVAKTTVDSAFSTTSLNPVENRVITAQHVNKSIAQENGVHGLRYYDESLSVYNETTEEWEDISTGGGGINLAEPSNVTLTNKDEAVLLKWSDPDDIVIDGTPVATWAGTKVVRKAGSAPTKATDGVLIVDSKVRDQYETSGFTDTGLTNGVTYYYGFFPYTTGMLYTYTCVKTFTPAPIYPTAIDDLAAAKGYQSAVVTFTAPADATGVRLVYGTTAPTGETDGTYIDGVTSPYTIDNLTNGTEYFIKAYTYNAKGRFTASNGASVTPSPVSIVVTGTSNEYVGKTVTVAGTTSQTQTFDSTLELTFEFPATGTYTVTDNYTGAVQTVNAAAYQEYDVDLYLARITVVLPDSGLIDRLQAKLYEVDNGTYTLKQTKTLSALSTSFYVATGEYKIFYVKTSSGNNVYCKAENYQHDSASINVTEFIEYTVNAKFAKINLAFTETERSYLSDSSLGGLRYIIYTLRAGESGDLITTDDAVIPSSTTYKTTDKFTDNTFYVITDSNIYIEPSNWEEKYGAQGVHITATAILAENGGSKIPQGYPSLTIPYDSTLTYTLTEDCGVLNVTFDDAYVGKTFKVTENYKFNNTNSNRTYKQVTIPASKSLVLGVIPSDVQNLRQAISLSTYDVQVIDTDGTTVLKELTGIQVNTGETENIHLEPFEFKIFAVHYSETNSDPDSCDYPEGYDNYGWTPMYVDLSTGAPVYNSFDPEGANASKVKWLFPRSCALKFDGTVDYYLDEDDESKKEDGTASDYNNTSYGGNMMMEWNQDDQNGAYIYWKILPDANNDGWTFIVANQPKDKDGNADADMKPWNHYDCNGGVAKHWYTAKYFGSNISSKIRSISGQTNYVNEDDAAETTKCRANNTGSDVIWDKEVYADWIFQGLLCVLFSKSLNTQAKFGYGRCSSSNTAAIGQGTMNGKGLFYGKSNQTEGVKVFGMENPWGNIWRRIRGLINVSGSVKVKMTHGTQDGSTVSDYNQTGSGYLTAGTIGGTSGGYIKNMNIQKYGLTPKTISGSDATYYPDGAWFNNSQTNVAVVGGDWHNALLVGAFCCNLGTTASHAGTYLGAALSCKPLA